MQIDPKGLEAAIEAAHDAWTNGCEHEADDLGLRHAVPAAITAYLSALSPAGTASEMEPVAWADPRAIGALFGTPAVKVYLSKNGSPAYSMPLYALRRPQP